MVESGRGIQQQPKIAKISASARWDGGVKSINRIRNFSATIMDEPEMLGGDDQGPNPMEFVMAALNGCVTVMASTIADEMGIKVKSLEMDAVGEIDLRGLMGVPGVRQHFQKVKHTVHIEAEASHEQIESLKEQVASRCPAINLLQDAGVDVIEDWHIHAAAA